MIYSMYTRYFSVYILSIPEIFCASQFSFKNGTCSKNGNGDFRCFGRFLWHFGNIFPCDFKYTFLLDLLCFVMLC